MRRSFFVASRVVPSLICFLRVVFAQDLAPPPNWQNTQSDLSRSQRQSVASEAAQKLQSHIDSSGMLPSGTQLTPTLKANMAIVLSSQDLLNGNMTWKSPVTKMLLSYDTGLDWNIDLSYFGLAELSAYLAYNDSTNLANAARNWDIAHTDFVTSAAAQSNSFPRTTNTTSECGTTLGGLIFDLHSNPSSSQAVSTDTISSWIAFSSRLAELTQNTTYLDAAKLSIQFAQTHLLNPGNVPALINASWSVSRCVSSGSPTTWDLGPFIEGLSIIANITQDQSYTQMLLDLVPNAVNAWTSDQGVITEQKGDYRKGTMIRGLLEAKRRNPSNTAMSNLIDDYITVQFNAVRNHALISDNNYGTSWIGDSDGSSTDYSYPGSVEALDVLNSAFAIASNDDTTTATHHSSTGAIVGGVIGGVVGAIALSLVLFYCLRRRRLRAREMPMREEKLDLSTSNEARLVPEPFVNVPSEPFRPPFSKGGSSYPQAGYLNGSLDGSDRMGAASSSDLTTDLGTGTRGADNAAMGSDGSALSTLARKLDNLIDVLAVRGVVEDTPPEYDGRHPALHGPGRS